MNLKLNLPTKIVNINGKDINIPKLGLKHYMIASSEKDPIAMLEKIVDSIEPNLTIAEKDIVIINILEFNDRLKSSVEINGKEVFLKDVYISQKTSFQFQGKEYKFRAPGRLLNGTVDAILSECYTGNQGEIDFLDMPAFVYKWLKDLTETVSIKTPTGVLSGATKIMETFSNGKV